MIRRSKIVLLLVIVSVSLLLSITIAYAALSKSLTVTTNKITQLKLTWDIGFAPGTVNGVPTSINNTATCGTATATKTTISNISPTLTGVGDRCSYTFNIVNNGDIAGIISSINITKPTNTTCTTSGSTMVCGDITYKLHYDSETSTSLVSLNDVINPKSSSPTVKTVVMTIEYTGANPSYSNYNQNGFVYNITYSQR